MSAEDNSENFPVEAGEPVFGMYPIDDYAPVPEVPNEDRIFAAAAELQKAYENADAWTQRSPLSKSMMLLALTAVEDGLRARIDEWYAGSRLTPFPDMFDAIDEIMRIVSKEGKEEHEASLRENKAASTSSNND